MASEKVCTVLSRLAERVPQVPLYIAGAVSLSVVTCLLFRSRPPRRTQAIAVSKEKVLVLGATSGVGRVIAQQYALRGAYVCVVGRREDKLNEVVQECVELAARNGFEGRGLGVRADISDVNDMIRVRETVEKAWSGLDTVIVAAGVSTLQPLMAVAGVEMSTPDIVGSQASPEGIQHAVNAAQAAVNGNYLGSLVAAVTLIPLLTYTSSSPSILLLSSAAAVLPPPTRSIYASTKCASLMLYQALQIEHPSIKFTFFFPGTIEGDFRASAVDNPPGWTTPPKIHEDDPNKNGLKREVVARGCIRAIDRGERNVYIPRHYRVAHVLYWFWPAFIEWRTSVKYNFR
ncbi:NAD(P)-binding protein [Pisolithus orientalis]|uniref:NAD(P)-binding protein n=1 Tax=Pisolithus orientalis TaxID=936130 RepID=UPI00222544FA|nr:NAD(P)-binding protein [Pisolithus orientalis]KAI5997780.1 NAD(P)-binding protein [Pisolithus orientalis]